MPPLQKQRRLLDDMDGGEPPVIRLPENQLPKGPPSADLYGAWKAQPSPKTLSPLLESVRPTIQGALRSYGFAGDPNMEATAQLHVISVLPRFDPKKSKLETFLHNELRRVQRLGPQQNMPIRAPERALLDNRALMGAEAELRGSLGRSPTVDELSDETGMSAKRIERVRMASRPLLTEDAMSGNGDDDSSPQLLGTESGRPEEVWMEAYYAGLEDPKDKLIFEWSLGWRGAPKRSKSDIARQLGISVGAVSQRADRLAGGLQQLVTNGERLL